MLTNSAGLASVKARLVGTKVGTQVVTASATTTSGMVAQTTFTINWKNKPSSSITVVAGKFKVKLSNAQGLPVLIKYGADKWELLVASSDSQIVSVPVAKGSYAITIQIGSSRTAKTVVVP